MKKLIASVMTIALLAALSVPAFASPETATSSSLSNETSHVEAEAEHDIENEVENEAAEIENEGADK